MDYGAMVLTAKKTWIKSTPQSTFKGSRRRVRWSILKELIATDTVSYKTMKIRYTHKDFDAIIQDMIRDKLITQDQDMLRIDTS
jgi:hypothetical protein